MLECDGRRKNGEIFSLEACFSGWDGPKGIQYGASLRDISARKREAEKVRYLAEHDTVTGLQNRNSLQTRLRAALATAGRVNDPRKLVMAVTTASTNKRVDWLNCLTNCCTNATKAVSGLAGFVGPTGSNV